MMFREQVFSPSDIELMPGRGSGMFRLICMQWPQGMVSL